MSDAEEIAVVYLLRDGNDPLWFHAFLQSMRRHQTRIEYTPIVLHKGYRSNQAHSLASSWKTSRGRSAECFFVDDEGFDLTAYQKISRSMSMRYCLFLNSYSRVLAPNWLETYVDGLSKLGDSSVVGASGNWGSINSEARFPNPHLRTTGIFLRRDLFASFDHPLETKEQCIKFESGASSLSDTVRRAGGQIALVGRSGRTFAPENWPESHVFYAGDQEELLVGDNRSHEYQIAKPKSRLKRSRAAWGSDRANIVSRSWLQRRYLHWQWKRGLPTA